MYGILVIEDDAGLNRGICFTLEREGYQVWGADTVKQACELYREKQPDLIVLDLNLPDGDGLKLCCRIRKESQIPIIMLTARDMETDEIIGLESGADDYIRKPFSLAVLKVRIQTALRKHQGGEREKTLYCGDLTLDPQRVKVFKGTGEIGLTTQEFRLLKYFMENRERVLLKEQIMDILWDQKGNFVEENTLPVTISRLRKKIEDDPVNPFYIKTVHGMGYLFHGEKE